MILRGISHLALQVFSELAPARGAEETVLRDAQEKLLNHLLGVFAVPNQRTHIASNSWGIAQHKKRWIANDIPLGGNVLQTRLCFFLLRCLHGCLFVSSSYAVRRRPVK